MFFIPKIVNTLHIMHMGVHYLIRNTIYKMYSDICPCQTPLKRIFVQKRRRVFVLNRTNMQIFHVLLFTRVFRLRWVWFKQVPLYMCIRCYPELYYFIKNTPSFSLQYMPGFFSCNISLFFWIHKIFVIWYLSYKSEAINTKMS